MIRRIQFFSVLALLALAGPPALASGEARLAELLGSRVGRYLVQETAQGRYLTRHLVPGGPGASQGAGEIALLRRALETPELALFSRELGRRFQSVHETILARRRARGVAADAELGLAERTLLDTFAIDQLRLEFRAAQAGRVQFLAEAPSYSFRTARSRFIATGETAHFPYRHVERIRNNPRRVVISEVEIDQLRPLHPVSRPEVPKPVGYIEELKRRLLTEGFRESHAVAAIRMPDGTMLIGSGHHRVQAMRELGQRTVPAEIHVWDELDQLTRDFYSSMFPDVFLPWVR